MKKKITTLEELEKEQQKLKMLMEVTRQEFARSLGTNRKQLQNFVITKVAIPAGAIGLGVSAMKQFSSSNHKKTNQTSTSELLTKLLPIGINLIQTYFLKKQNNKLTNISTETQQTQARVNQLKSVA